MSPSSSKVQDLGAIDASANVVVDMFLDTDPITANSTTLPKYEVMIWLADFGGKRPSEFPFPMNRSTSHMMQSVSVQISRIHLHTVSMGQTCKFASFTF